MNYIVPKKNQNNHLLKLNEKILNHFSEEKFNKIPKYKLIIKLIDIIKDDLSKEEHNIIYNKTEIFRRNNENLNCKFDILKFLINLALYLNIVLVVTRFK